MSLNSKPKIPNRPTGVTLMEVLFAIGIIMMGLLGIAALIPVAGHYASRGLRLDHASAVGRNAFREFETRGMANRENWFPQNVAADQPGASFCIDPRFMAAHGNATSTFPYGAGGTQPFMHRITLQSGLQSPPAPMSSTQADNIFMSRDDLSIIVPDHDRTLRPVRQMGITQDETPTRSQFEGRMSWFATLVPKMNTHQQFIDSGTERRQHVLSIVVLHRRDAGFTIDDPLPGMSPNERVADVQFLGGFWGGGGGDVRLAAMSPDTLELQDGDWVMLSGYVRRQDAPVGTPYFRWYRVAMTEDEPRPEGNHYVREATLIGPDWNTTTAPTFSSQFFDDNISAQAVLVTGVVSVFEKTVNLERSSLWN